MQTNLQTTATIDFHNALRKNEVKIGTLGKACIYQNEYDVWQFRTWLADENKYYRISLRTKQRADALEKAEDLYAEMRVAKKQGKKYFSISIKDAVAKYLEFRKKDVGKGRGAGIVEGRYGTIKAHLNHFLNYVHKDAKVKDLGKNTLVEYEREGITTDYIRFRKQQKAADLFYGLQLYVFETPVYMGWVKFYMMFVFPLMFLALSPIYIIFMFIAVLELSYRKIGNIFIWTLILGFLGYFFFSNTILRPN